MKIIFEFESLKEAESIGRHLALFKYGRMHFDSVVDLPRKISATLREAGYNTFRDLVALKYDEVFEIQGIDQEAAFKIIKAMRAEGVELHED